MLLWLPLCEATVDVEYKIINVPYNLQLLVVSEREMNEIDLDTDVRKHHRNLAENSINAPEKTSICAYADE